VILQILARTPLWVWLLLCVLLAYGLAKTRDRIVTYRRAMILPAVMPALSLAGLASNFGLDLPVMAAWAAGVAFALVLNRRLKWPWAIRYLPRERSYALGASWFPLVLIMCIFTVSYFVGVSLAMRLEFARSGLFSPAVASIYGLLGGIFLAGGLRSWRLAIQKGPAVAQP
jgi:hypothetical protein